MIIVNYNLGGEGVYTPLPAGRQLETYSASDGKQYNYYYNSDGFLSHIDAYNKSDVQTDSFDYIWDGDKLIARKYYSYSDDEGLISQVLYDSEDEAIGFITYGFEADTVTYEDIYLYRKNLQGDITGVLTYTGKLIAEYSYDAYGNVFIDTSDVSMAIGSIFMMLSNPLMYRGYVYTFLGDEISYYLGSRYYIPQLGRFLNADKHTDTGTGVIGTNMYAYCNNNPVMNIDPTGEAMNAIVRIISWFKKLVQALSKITPKTTITTTVQKKDYEAFLNALGEQESSNSYTKVNSYGYLGKYQLGTPALIDSEFKNKNGAWSELAQKYGVYSDEDFLNTPTAQEEAIRRYHKKLWSYIENYNLTKKVTTKFNGIKVTQSGLLAACHLVGAHDVYIMFDTGEIKKDANGTSATYYMEKFAGYDLSQLFNSVG